jgi:mono/diheme cytochrome c family protein
MQRWAAIVVLAWGAGGWGGTVMAADSAASQIEGWSAVARQTHSGFAASAARGEVLYSRVFSHTPGLPSCAACHTANPAAAGQHAVTNKTIQPMATAVNAGRFTDAAKTEKWFKRNCIEVIGKECTAAEKADFVAYLTKVGTK